MRRRRTTLVPIVTGLLALVLGAAAPALAQEEGEESPAPQPESTFAEDEAPAVVISDENAQEDDTAWTFRFLVPTVLALSGLALAAVAFAYGFRLRGRYRVVR